MAIGILLHRNAKVTVFYSQRLWCMRLIYSNRHFFFLLKGIFCRGCRYNFKIMFVYGFVSIFKVYVKTQDRLQME